MACRGTAPRQFHDTTTACSCRGNPRQLPWETLARLPWQALWHTVGSPTTYHDTLHGLPQERLVACERQPTGSHGEPTALMTLNPTASSMTYHGRQMAISTVASTAIYSTCGRKPHGNPNDMRWQALRHTVACPTPYHGMHHGIPSRPMFEIVLCPGVLCGRMRFDAVYWISKLCGKC